MKVSKVAMLCLASCVFAFGMDAKPAEGEKKEAEVKIKEPEASEAVKQKAITISGKDLAESDLNDVSANDIPSLIEYLKYLKLTDTTGTKAIKIDKALSSNLLLNKVLSGGSDEVKLKTILARAQNLAHTNGLSQDGVKLSQGLAQILDKEEAKNILTADPAKAASQLNELASSLKESMSDPDKISAMDSINFQNQLATGTRLARLSSPYGEDIALAKAILNLKNDSFADNGDSLERVLGGYTGRFKYTNNLWANIMGANAKRSNVKILGMSLGYDMAFDSAVLGGFASVANSKTTGSYIGGKGKHYQAGIYARYYIQNSELDGKIAFGTAKNHKERKALGQSYKADFDSKFVALDFDYGYVVDLAKFKEGDFENTFLKPFVGLGYLNASTSGYTEQGKGELRQKVEAQTLSVISLRLGAELRHYTQKGSYVYIKPGFEQELARKNSGGSHKFINGNKDLRFASADGTRSFVTVQGGFDLEVNQSLSTNLNLGAKFDKKDNFYSGSLGARFKF